MPVIRQGDSIDGQHLRVEGQAIVSCACWQAIYDAEGAVVMAVDPVTETTVDSDGNDVFVVRLTPAQTIGLPVTGNDLPLRWIAQLNCDIVLFSQEFTIKRLEVLPTLIAAP
jgi:hypothetical protein